jgi:hypothetical protein
MRSKIRSIPTLSIYRKERVFSSCPKLDGMLLLVEVEVVEVVGRLGIMNLVARKTKDYLFHSCKYSVLSPSSCCCICSSL